MFALDDLAIVLHRVFFGAKKNATATGSEKRADDVLKRAIGLAGTGAAGDKISETRLLQRPAV